MKKEIVILTGNNNFFGQTRKPWVSLNFDKMQSILNANGFKIKQYEFHEIFNKKIEIKNSIIFYTFSQKVEIRNYINDILTYLANFNNELIPKLELLRCHENKGYQELYKRTLGVKSLNTFYFSNLVDLESYEFQYPIVFKTIDGSNGKGVYLIKSQKELFETVRKYEKNSFFERLDLFRRKYFRKKKTYKEYPDYSNEKDLIQYSEYIKPSKRFVLQEFVPNLKWDYRVLIISDRFYITKRHVRANDFRASGAKIFDFNFEPNPQILNFAKDIFSKFDNPYLSIDIAFDDDNCYLLEYQALHFGLNVLVKSQGYYSFSNDKWSLNIKTPEIEEDLIYGLVKYLKNGNKY
jgi:glutathione synthase/RimK-type ligase-like ATP-grasp enzyme